MADERREMLETLAGDAFVLVARRGGDVWATPS